MAAENRRRCRLSTASLMLVMGLIAGTTAIAQPAPRQPADPRAPISWSPERNTASRATVSALDPIAPPTSVVGERYSVAQSPTALAPPRSVTGAAAPDSGQLALLVRNPKLEEGLPPFALADQTGTVQRYVEPVEGIELERFVGQVVVVRHDTGRTLLASQLDLPHDGPFTPGGSVSQAPVAAVSRRDAAVMPARHLQEENRQPPDQIWPKVPRNQRRSPFLRHAGQMRTFLRQATQCTCLPPTSPISVLIRITVPTARVDTAMEGIRTRTDPVRTTTKAYWGAAYTAIAGRQGAALARGGHSTRAASTFGGGLTG
jgi:hypothetical protein